MKAPWLVSALLVGSTLVGCEQAHSKLDTVKGELLPEHEVLVEGKIIREVSGYPIAAPDALVIDLGGRTLMPGLCDAHVHVTAIEPDLTKLDRLSPSYITARSINVLSRMLRRGIHHGS